MPKKILIVDDKPFMVRLIQHHLERAGYELIKARNQTEANNLIATESPELVVMNETNGAPEDPRPASQPSSGALPVIRMTDVPQNEDKPANDDVVLTRPFSPTHLVAEVKRLIPN